MDNSEIIWDFFKNKGLTDYVVAGIVGNIYVESKLSPSNLQDRYNKKFNLTDAEYTEQINNGSYGKEQFKTDKAGYGLIQWTYYSRKEKLYDFMMNKYQTINNLQGQLEFIWQELSTDYKKALRDLKQTTSLVDATVVFMDEYEQPGAGSTQSRLLYATQFFQQYAGKDSTDHAYIVNVSTYLNIRKDATVTSDKIGKLQKGQAVYITEVKNKFGKLKNQDGWVSMDYLV